MWWRDNMKIQAVALVLLATLCMAGPSHADQEPFKQLKTLEFDLTYKGQDSAAVSAAASLPYVLIREGGGVYSLLDLESLETHLLTDNATAEKSVTVADWGNDHLALFSSYGQFLRRIDPKNPGQPEDISAEIQHAPLRHFIWLGKREILIDEVTPYVVEDNVLTPRGSDQHR